MKLKHRITYDDDGIPLPEGSKVLVNGEEEGILHFDSNGEIRVRGTKITRCAIETEGG